MFQERAFLPDGNPAIKNRVAAILDLLRSMHKGGRTISTASRGNEREAFISLALASVFPPPFRFGTGDITDRRGTRSGQMDIVVEFPHLPSLPLVSGSPVRLYMAESVAAVIEVKSNLKSQWCEVVSSATTLRKLERDCDVAYTMDIEPTRHVPYFVVGYEGWRDINTLRRQSGAAPVDGVLQIDRGHFVAGSAGRGVDRTGPWSLWELIGCLHDAAVVVRATSDSPFDYGPGGRPGLREAEDG